MRIVTKTALLPLAVALAGLTAGGASVSAIAQTAVGASAPVVQLATGRGRLIQLSAPVSDVFVADEKVADIQVRSATQIYLFAKAPGETTVSATTKGGKVVYSSVVRVGNNYDSIGQMLALAMPEAHIVATPLNGVVLLTGTVAGPQEAAEAQELTQAFVGTNVKVVSRIKSAVPLQVNLQVKIAEVSRTFAKNISSNITTIDGTGGFKFGVATGRAPATTFTTDRNLPLGVGLSAVNGYRIDPITGQIVQAAGTAVQKGAEQTTLGGITKVFGLDVLSALDLGERNGQVSTLANPNLSAMSGETGSFLAGGEIPIPVSQGLGAVSVEYKQYGVSLTYTPTVLADGRISLRVRPEVSQLSSAGAVTIGGTQIPALTTRRAETTVELGSGQSMMIGGLLQNVHNNIIDKTPGAGDIPVLGALFRSNAFQRNETELMIIITPYLVKPVDANSIVLPTDAYQAPTDAGRILLGQLGGGKTGGDRPKPSVVAPANAVPTLSSQGVPLPQQAPVQDTKAAANSSKPKKGAAIAAPGFSQ